MIRYAHILILSFLISCTPKLGDIKESQASSNKWVSLFNGKNLDGWTTKINGYPLGNNFANTFRVEEGIMKIRYDGYGDNFNNRFGAIYFDKKLRNYRVKVEYRFVGETAPGGPSWGYRDSGVQFHSQSPASMKIDQRFPVCLEYNLHGGNGSDDRPVGEICANGMLVEINGKHNDSYCTAASIKRTFHGDQWVTLEIDIRDNEITHLVNGEKILSYSNPVYNPNHDLGKAFIEREGGFIKEGYLSLQSNSHPIDFRKIELLAY